MRSRVTVDGMPLSYLSGGEGPATLLLHTIGGSASEWTRITPALDERLATIALDLPGHGESAPLDEQRPVPDIAGVIVAFLDRLGLERISVVGSSMSGSDALELAIRYPERVERVVLVSATGPWADQPGLPVRHNLPTHTSENKEIGWFRSQFHDPAAAAEAGFFEWWVATRSAADDGMIRAWRRRPLPERSLSECRAPLLLIRGEHDPLHPAAWSQAWVDLLPQGEVATIDGARHFLNLEAPAALAALLIEFLAP